MSSHSSGLVIARQWHGERRYLPAAVNDMTYRPDVQADGDSRLCLAPAHYFDAPKDVAGVLKRTGKMIWLAHGKLLYCAFEGASELEKAGRACDYNGTTAAYSTGVSCSEA